jgi:hypothetical protein
MRKIHPKGCGCKKCSHKREKKDGKRFNYLLILSVILIGILA